MLPVSESLLFIHESHSFHTHLELCLNVNTQFYTSCTFVIAVQSSLGDLYLSWVLLITLNEF